MKKLLMIMALGLSTFALYSQQPRLSAKEKAQAEKKAEKLAETYEKDGFKPYNSSESLYDFLYDFFRYTFAKDDRGHTVYIIPKKHKGSGNTETEALESALLKEKKLAVALINMYFHNFISSEPILLSEKKEKKLTKAADDTWKYFKNNLDKIKCVKKYVLIKEEKGKYLAHVYAVFDKKEIFDRYRNKITDYMITKKKWSKEKTEKYLPAKWYERIP
jgi:hypothetical protein